MDRRQFIMTIGMLGVGTISGCLGDDGDDTGDDTGAPEDDDDDDPTDDARDDTPDSTPAYDVSVDIPADVVYGDDFEWSWIIENTGDAVGDGVVVVTVDLPDGSTEGDEYDIDLDPEAVEKETYDAIADFTGSVTITVEAPDGTVDSTTLDVERRIDEATAAAHLNDARSALESADVALHEAIHDDDIDLDGGDFSPMLTTASDALWEAEVSGTDEQRAIVDGLSDYETYLSQYAWSHVRAGTVVDGELTDGLDRYWYGREQYFQEDVGTDDLETAHVSFEHSAFNYEEGYHELSEALDAAAQAEGVLTGIDPNIVNDFEAVSFEDAIDRIEGQLWFVQELREFTAGLHHASVAWILVSTGFLRFEYEDWEGADADMSAAGSEFIQAEEFIDELDIDEFDFVLDAWDEVLCEISAGPSATDHWSAAAEAAQADNWDEHESEIEAGWEPIEECHE